MEQRGWALYGLIFILVAGIGVGLWNIGCDTAPQPLSEPVASTTEQIIQEEESEPQPAFQFELRTTEAEHAQGLSGRESVPENYGMLFVFQKPGNYGFWMKDMRIPIDILWLADDGTILGVEEAVSPDTYPNPFYPPSPVRYVLETKVWESHRQGWEVGDRISLPAPYGQ